MTGRRSAPPAPPTPAMPKAKLALITTSPPSAAPAAGAGDGVNLQLFRDVAASFGRLAEFDARVRARGIDPDQPQPRSPRRRPKLHVIAGGLA